MTSTAVEEQPVAAAQSRLVEPRAAACALQSQGADKPLAVNDNQRKFPVILASEAMKWPPPVYWDTDELFLRASGGSVSMIYADFSNCKSTFALCRAIEIAKTQDARVLYIAAEGVGFLGPKTLLGAVVDWNNAHPDDPITEEWINDHFHLIAVAPKLLSKLDLTTLKEEQADWEPNLVYIDTLGASAAGENLSDIAVGTGIGQSLRQFCQKQEAGPYVSDVFVVHHLGKDKEKGATGSQYFMNDTDQTLKLTYHDKEGLLDVEVTKARGGEKGRKVRFGVRKVRLPTQAGGTTVAVYPLPRDDARLAVKLESKRDQEAERVYQVLKGFGPPGTVVSQADLLAMLVVKEHGEGEQQFKDRRDDWRRNRLPRLVWQKGRKGSGRPGAIFGLLHGVALEHPAKPRQPYTFEVPREVHD